MSTELALPGSTGLPGLMNALMPRSLPEVVTFADRVGKTQFVPTAYRGKPDEIIAAVMYGAELGLTPMQALQCIAIINGKPSIYGDGMLAVCQNHPKWAGKEERVEGQGDNRAAICTVRRKGEPDATARFSVGDARKAGLWGKTGPWSQYSDRMLLMRARGFALRDQFADKLRGIISLEEAQDYPAQPHVGPTRARDITPGPIEDPAELIEVIGVWGGDPEYLAPGQPLLDWIDGQLKEAVDVDGLRDWVKNNESVPQIVDAGEMAIEVLEREAREAKPKNGNGKLVMYDEDGNEVAEFDKGDAWLADLEENATAERIRQNLEILTRIAHSKNATGDVRARADVMRQQAALV